MKKAFLNWSSGKDSAFALYKLHQQQEYSVEKLVTTVNTDFHRVSMHGLREELLIGQAKSIGLPLHKISLDGNVSMETYNEVMQKETANLVSEGFTHSVFGDIFLEDLRQYREKQLEKSGLKAVFPLWKNDTSALIADFIKSGFKAVVVCTNAKYLDESFCGRVIDEDFIADLPKGVDPCGENGEFHTFVFDGPIFQKPVKYRLGEKVNRAYTANKNKEDNCFSAEEKSWDTGFWYCDLLPK